MERFEWMACLFVGVPCVIVLLIILPIMKTIGGVFGVSCIVMTFMIASARSFKGISEIFLKKGKRGRDV